jgi:hypothetical protein
VHIVIACLLHALANGLSARCSFLLLRWSSSLWLGGWSVADGAWWLLATGWLIAAG